MVVSPETKGSNIAEPVKASASRENSIAAILIVIFSFTFFLFQYNRNRATDTSLTDWAVNTVTGRVFAPDVYRIGVPWLTLTIKRLTHIRVNQSLPTIEGICYGFALFLLYLLLRQLNAFQTASRAYRAAAVGFFLALAQLPVLWLFSWERAETLPTAFYVAAVVLLASARRRVPFTAAMISVTVLSLGQSFLRTEVPTEVGIAFLVTAMLPAAAPRPRWQMATMGIAMAVVGSGIQVYLQDVLYPGFPYAPGVPKIQLLWNLRPFFPHDHWPIFFCAVTPLIFTLVLLRTQRLRVEPTEALVILVCLMYLPVWWIAGLISEVRIYVPFLTLASPVMARVWTTYIVGEQTTASSWL